MLPIIKDKLASDEFIISRGMNYTPFSLVSGPSGVLVWSQTVSAKHGEPFSIRFKGKGMQPFVPNLSHAQVFHFAMKHFKTSSTPLGIYAATEHYDQYRVANAEIRINEDMTVDGRYCIGSLKMRDALASPSARNLVGASLFTKSARWAIEYALRFGVIGKVLELTLFSVPVGVENEKIVCWEVRDF